MPTGDRLARGWMPAVADHTRPVRVAATPDRVRDELSSLDTMLNLVPGIVGVTLRGAEQARVAADVSLGGYQARLNGAARVTDRRPGRCSIRIDLPELPLTYWLELLVTPDGDGTRVLLRAKVVNRRRELAHLRRALQLKVEEHLAELGARLTRYLDGSASTPPLVPAQRQPPGPGSPVPGGPVPGGPASGSEAGVTGRLRRLLVECTPGERETEAYRVLQRILTELRGRFPGPEPIG